MEDVTFIGSYRVLNLQHASPKTTIYLAETAMKDTVVLKRCRPGTAKCERQTLMALKKADPECKFVVRLLDHVNGCDADPLESLVLEAGIISLEAWLRERQYQPSWSQVLEAGYAVGRALAWLHAQGLCHTDLKPSNVLLTATGWKLCDFASATKEGALFGEATFHYCAPEQVKLMIQNLPLVASFDADVWAYSKMLYEMAVGSPDALVSPSTSDVLTLEVIAAFKDPVVVEEKLRFAVVRALLLSSLCVRTPRPSMERIMAKGFWTGAPTSQVGEELDFSSRAGGETGGTSTSEGKLELAVQELLDTEAEYCMRMRIFVEKVVQPLKERVKDGKLNGMNSESLRMFVEIENLLRLNSFFLKQLRTRYETEKIRCIGEIMCEFANTLLRNYEDFVASYPYANDCLQKDKRNSRILEETLETSLQSLPPNCQQPLEFFLILPVQRLMRYKMLLERIVKHTQDEQAFRDLESALGALCETIDSINESTPSTDSTGTVTYGARSLSRHSLEMRSWSAKGAANGSWTWVGAASLAFAGLLGLGVVWGVSKLLRERAHSHFRIKELELTAEAAGLLAAAERLKTEQARAAAQVALANVQASKETTKTVGAATLGAVAIGAMLLLSDERVKVNVRRVGTSPSGIPIHRFAYCWAPEEEWEGVLAQEVLQIEMLKCDDVEDDWVLVRSDEPLGTPEHRSDFCAAGDEALGESAVHFVSLSLWSNEPHTFRQLQSVCFEIRQAVEATLVPAALAAPEPDAEEISCMFQDVLHEKSVGRPLCEAAAGGGWGQTQGEGVFIHRSSGARSPDSSRGGGRSSCGRGGRGSGGRFLKELSFHHLLVVDYSKIDVVPRRVFSGASISLADSVKEKKMCLTRLACITL